MQCITVIYYLLKVGSMSLIGSMMVALNNTPKYVNSLEEEKREIVYIMYINCQLLQ